MTEQLHTFAGRVTAGRWRWAHRQSPACPHETAQPCWGERSLADLCPPGDGLSGSKKNEGLSGAAVFY